MKLKHHNIQQIVVNRETARQLVDDYPKPDGPVDMVSECVSIRYVAQLKCSGQSYFWDPFELEGESLPPQLTKDFSSPEVAIIAAQGLGFDVDRYFDE